MPIKKLDIATAMSMIIAFDVDFINTFLSINDLLGGKEVMFILVIITLLQYVYNC